MDNIRICEVISVDDQQDGNRIKVRLLPEDGSTPISELPYAIPLLPQMIHVKPKVHEAVLILTAVGDGYSQRFYIGPVISQINHMEEENFSEAKRLFNSSSGKLADAAVSRDVNRTKGAFPENEDIAICGRKNSDIILTDDDVRIRCGAKVSNGRNPYFNYSSPAYLKLKYYPKSLTDNDRCMSTATLVADKINLISNNSKEWFFTGNRDDLITDSVMLDILNKAHELPYGDILVEFLKIFRTAFLNHTHPFPMFIPCKDKTCVNLETYDMDKMLSDSVRIN